MLQIFNYFILFFLACKRTVDEIGFKNLILKLLFVNAELYKQ